jgi:hypothetical protein
LIYTGSTGLNRINGGTADLIGPVRDGNFRILTGVFNGASSTIIANGSRWSTGNAGTHTLTGLTIGAAYDASNCLNGDIAELIVYNATLTTAQRKRVERYLSKKWGVALVNTIVSDTYTRADSALTLGNAETGQAYTAVAGTWGVSSGKAYSASDTNVDVAVIESGLADCTVSVVMNGDVNTGANNFSIPQLLLRYADANNFLILNGVDNVVGLSKIDGGVGSSLVSSGATTTTDNMDYSYRTVLSGNSITVYKDGTSVLTHTLAGGDTKYAAYTQHGFRLRKSGTPSYNARWDSFVIEA